MIPALQPWARSSDPEVRRNTAWGDTNRE